MQLRNLLLGASIIAFTVASAYAGEDKKSEEKDKAATSQTKKQTSEQASKDKAAAGTTAKKEADGKKDAK